MLDTPQRKCASSRLSRSRGRDAFVRGPLGLLCALLFFGAACAKAKKKEAKPEPTYEALPEAEPARSREVCAQHLFVSWRGAAYVGERIKRSRIQARDRIEKLRLRALAGEDFVQLAKRESDPPPLSPEQEALEPAAFEGWPGVHAMVLQSVFRLEEGEIGKVEETNYGYLVLRRCAASGRRARHLLIRYAGAENADLGITRSRSEALALIRKLERALDEGKADLPTLARQRSDDKGGRDRETDALSGGQAPRAYLEALAKLKVGERSSIVETPFGFYILERTR